MTLWYQFFATYTLVCALYYNEKFNLMEKQRAISMEIHPIIEEVSAHEIHDEQLLR